MFDDALSTFALALAFASGFTLLMLLLFVAVCCVVIAAGVHSSPRTPQSDRTPEPTTNAASDPFTK
ncbi:hypothetical protein ACFYY1_39180 [Streptomyces sp. NPDC001890]|uniref:hypothetical protein n=1 Tax=Streptomyces sp. NPDC001890 TaxID=3364620 RepID=UPI0036A84A44